MKIAYWIVTVPLCLFLVFGGFLDITHKPEMVAGIRSLGYPEYFLTIDGLAKFLAVLALLVPGFPTLREWAYAGVTFLVIGATWSHAASHQNFAPAIVVLAFAQASYWLWRKIRAVAAKP
jgi:hypothetical protein